MSLMYFSRSGQALRSATALRPGLGVQLGRIMPGMGSRCLPRYGSVCGGSPNAQSSNSTSVVVRPCLVGEGEELVQALLQPGGIVLPDEVLHEDAAGVEAQSRAPAEFAVDGLLVERFRRPELGGVGRRAGDVVEADDPRLLLAPGPGLVARPAPLRKDFAASSREMFITCATSSTS